MRLQAKTRYGVRAVFDIAFHQTEGAVQAKDIARREEIPLRYLEQIFQDLKRAGIVESRRGPRGGYTLRRSPDDLRLGEVVRALQGSVEVDIEHDAGSPGGRVTASLWRELQDHVGAWFDGVTFGDLVRRAGELGVGAASQPPMYFI
ncbi:MAG TPA: Rrf2 family transcriptional regulator [Haliangiales bacterium]|nr:Rrf2 family transcriptional regulator [Haliangiales bacterium]